MKKINKKGIVFSLALLLTPWALAGHGGHHHGGRHGGHHHAGGHHGGWHGGHHSGWHGGHRGGWRGGYGHGHRGGWYGTGGRWVGGVWYGPRALNGCRNVLVSRRMCSPTCYWDYRYQAERCKTRCFTRPVWVRRCW